MCEVLGKENDIQIIVLYNKASFLFLLTSVSDAVFWKEAIINLTYIPTSVSELKRISKLKGILELKSNLGSTSFTRSKSL